MPRSAGRAPVRRKSFCLGHSAGDPDATGPICGGLRRTERSAGLWRPQKRTGPAEARRRPVGAAGNESSNSDESAAAGGGCCCGGGGGGEEGGAGWQALVRQPAPTSTPLLPPPPPPPLPPSTPIMMELQEISRADFSKETCLCRIPDPSPGPGRIPERRFALITRRDIFSYFWKQLKRQSF